MSLFGDPNVTADGHGNLFLSRRNRVRKITPDGVISTVAGTGEYGYSGDNGPAVTARLASPTGLAVNDAGDLFIADGGNSVVRKVTPGGIITTFAGGGTQGDGGPAIDAELAGPSAIAVDGSVVYVADGGVIRKVDADGIMSSPIGGLPWVQDVAVDTAHNLYVAVDGQVLRVDARGHLTAFAGTGEWGYSGDGGLATKAKLRTPSPWPSIAAEVSSSLTPGIFASGGWTNSASSPPSPATGRMQTPRVMEAPQPSR